MITGLPEEPKFRVSQSPYDGEEGMVVDLETAAEMLGIDKYDLYERSLMAVSVSRDGYILEVR